MSLAVYKRLVLFIVFLSFVGIFLGSYVRLSHAGLGCPDWPGCYGHFWVPQTQGDQAQSEHVYGTPVFFDLAAKEMVHRYVVSLLGLAVVILFFMTLFGHLRTQRRWTTALLALVVVQGLFGMWTVTLKLWPIVVTTHLMGGIATFCLALWLFFRVSLRSLSTAIPPFVRFWSCFTLVLLILQILLGGWVSTNYAGLSCETPFLCQGKLLPPLHFLISFGLESHRPLLILPPVGQVTVLWTHRVFALLVLLAVFILIAQLLRLRLRRLSRLLFVLVVAQVSLGVSNIVFHLPKAIAVAHTIGAALLLGAVLHASYLVFHPRIDPHKDD